MSKPTSATVTFAVGANTVTMPAPEPGYTFEVVKAQAVGQTAAGADFVYDKGYTVYSATLTFRCTLTQMDAFTTWFNTHADGAVNTFTYTDHFSTPYTTCRFLSATVRWAKTSAGQYTTTLEFRVSTVLD